MFASCGGYFLEFEKNADPHYDSCGLGRIHRRGVPGELCLSVPFAKHPNYRIGEENPRALSLCSSKVTGGVRQYGADAAYETQSTEASAERAAVVMKNALGLTEMYEVTENGVSIAVTGAEEIAYEIPVFADSGEEKTTVTVSDDGKALTVIHRGHRCIWTTDGQFEDTGETFRNRNGEYRNYRAAGRNTLNLTVTLT